MSCCTNSALEILAKRSEQWQGVIWECCLALQRWKHTIFHSTVSNKEKSNRSLAPTHPHSSMSTWGLYSHCTAQEVGQAGTGISFSSFMGLIYAYQGFHLFSLLSRQDSGCGLLFFLVLPSSLGTLRTKGNWNFSTNLNSLPCQRLNKFF